ncbi:Crossover junction endonuclease EME1B [Sesamum alatum]|uniref:Crossover junction endonuclease EME1B n=1 Tax=Sesamum alatum TaxID=300844 RepID=A0AAE1YI28_9LAMI|nr:Crossover junction endonuclease EME1B [Sesamum alatum]
MVGLTLKLCWTYLKLDIGNLGPGYYHPKPPKSSRAERKISNFALSLNLDDMSQPIPVDILSDSDSDSGGNRTRDLRNEAIDLITPPPSLQSKKKQRTEAFPNPSNSTVFIIDDDPTPCKKSTSSLGPKSSTTPSVVAETPFSDASIVKCSRGKCSLSGESLAFDPFVVADTPMREPLDPGVSIAKCNAGKHNREPACSTHNSAEINRRICVESDNESENIGGFGEWKNNERISAAKLMDESETGSRFVESSFSLGISVQLQKKPPIQSPVKVHMSEGCSSPSFVEAGMSLACEDCDDKASTMDPVGKILKDNNGCHIKEKKKAYETMKPKRISKEERLRLMEEKKQLKEQEKLLKAASKAEAAEMKNYKKEMQKWEKGKYALKSIVAEIDKKVVELGSVGGHLLTRFAEKGLTYRITTNPMEKTIVWSMVIPEEISVIASEPIEISYILILYEAEEFCNLVMNESLMDHVQSVQHRYPHHTVCYVTNRLMAYINKREQAQYKNPANYAGWKRPAIEEVLARLATHFFKVHSRHCVDEAELAEHVVGLTCSLASCQFRKKLTRLSVNANGSIIPKDCVDKNLIKKNLWLKALVAIPKVQPRFAMAIWKKYPTMKSLLSVYMDPTKSVHEKEFLLKDLTTESLLGDERRLGEVCSKRIYRILMAQCGNIKTDDVENGADFFIITPLE